MKNGTDANQECVSPDAGWVSAARFLVEGSSQLAPTSAPYPVLMYQVDVIGHDPLVQPMKYQYA